MQTSFVAKNTRSLKIVIHQQFNQVIILNKLIKTHPAEGDEATKTDTQTKIKYRKQIAILALKKIYRSSTLSNEVRSPTDANIQCNFVSTRSEKYSPVRQSSIHNRAAYDRTNSD